MTTKHHLPCDSCGSSDGMSQYDDGHTWCFVCETRKGSNSMTVEQTNTLSQGITLGFRDRGITSATCKKYGVTAVGNADNITKHIYPYTTREGKHVANKLRVLPKTFAAEGSMNNNVALFGQDKFESGGRAITIFEGELDALAGFQLTGSMFPCVSLPNGANSAKASIKHNLEYLESFSKIVLCFDNDDAGKKAVADVVSLFAVGKVSVMKLDPKKKDACDYLIANDSAGFTKAWHRSQPWTPDGIICSSDMMDLVMEEDTTESVSYPWEGLNKLTYGIRKSELVMFTAKTGIGKTQILRELIHHIHTENPEAKIGTLFLEEQPKDSALGLMSIEASIPFHLPDSVYTVEDKKQARSVISDGSFYFYENFGEHDVDKLLNRIRYYAKGLDCDYIVLDHISIMVSGGEHGDERKTLDEITTKLKKLTIELNVAVLAVVHLNRQGQIRGTAGVEQLSNIVVHLDRDNQADTAEKRNTTKVSVWKNRFSGKTGVGCYLHYDEITGRLNEVPEPADDDEGWGKG